MPRLSYKQRRFSEGSRLVIARANAILEEYAALGYDLTLRQLFYQFVARGLVPNKQSEYKRLGDIVNDGRMAGLIDWNYIVDRTRNLRRLSHWDDPAALIRDTSRWFHIDKWEDQPYRLEVWIEKDALVGVIEGVANDLDVPYFSCRGYTSQSEVWGAAQRLLRYLKNGQDVRILHLGDHDPSGIDMTRDIEDRLRNFLNVDWLRAHRDDWQDLSEANRDVTMEQMLRQFRPRFGVDRLALNMDQIEEHDPPPNPAKMTDSRFRSYVAEHGDESWELDALPPDVLAGLIQTQVESYRDETAWGEAVEREAEYVALLDSASENWENVAEFLRENGA